MFPFGSEFRPSTSPFALPAAAANFPKPMRRIVSAIRTPHAAAASGRRGWSDVHDTLNREMCHEGAHDNMEQNLIKDYLP